MRVITRKWILVRTLIVFFLLLTPLLEVLLVSVEDRYSLGSNVSEVTSKLSYIGMKTFSGKGQIDILFAGPSSVWLGVNARMVEGYLRHVTGKRDISVENFAHHGMGYESDYYILRELVSRREVKTIILGVENKQQSKTHRMVRFLWNPLKDWEAPDISSSFYAEKILDSLPTIVKSFLPGKIEVKPEIRKTNGANLVILGFQDEDEDDSDRREFVFKNIPRSSVDLQQFYLKAEDSVVTGKYSRVQEYFLRKIIALAGEKNIQLYFMNVPSLHPTHPLTKVPVYQFEKGPAVTVPVLGLPASRVFGTTSRDEVLDYFFNTEHLNMSGATNFTQLLFPAMKEIYEKSHR